ncbi:MAG: glycosyltransferase [Lachnospiraceae bacterium]|nr:glycosyltransferase [Lachnospiraceae bacterium]
MITVSIIVPVFNVEKYLSECLESIISYADRNMEIICIDDGSTDRSYEIILQYQKRYPDLIRCMKHECNKGLSEARNTGLKYARGKYVWFVDSDDMLMGENPISFLYVIAENYNTDIVFFDMEKFEDDMPCEYSKNAQDVSLDNAHILSGRELFRESINENRIKCESCRQFFRKDFLINNHLEFVPGLLHEDNVFWIQCCMKAERILNLNCKFYRYRQRPGSICHVMSPKRVQSVFVIFMEIYMTWKQNYASLTEQENQAFAKYMNRFFDTWQLYREYDEGNELLNWLDAPTGEIYNIVNCCKSRWLKIEEKELEILRKQKQIIVFGAGVAAKSMIRYLCNQHIKIEAVGVTNTDGNPAFLSNIPVKPIEQLTEYRETAMIVIGVTNRYGKGIYEQLGKLGFQHIMELETL